jgi:hypothetical protein
MSDPAAILMADLNAEQAITAVPELELVRWTGEAGPASALHAALVAGMATAGPDAVCEQIDAAARQLIPTRLRRQLRPSRRSRPRCLDVRAAADDARLRDRAAAGHGPSVEPGIYRPSRSACAWTRS